MFHTVQLHHIWTSGPLRFTYSQEELGGLGILPLIEGEDSPRVVLFWWHVSLGLPGCVHFQDPSSSCKTNLGKVVRQQAGLMEAMPVSCRQAPCCRRCCLCTSKRNPNSCSFWEALVTQHYLQKAINAESFPSGSLAGLNQHHYFVRGLLACSKEKNLGTGENWAVC